MEQLFVYGTLRDPSIQQLVFGRAIPMQPDVLPGFKKTEIALTNGVFPIIVETSGSSVEGFVLKVTPEELARGDRYETSAYRRIRVTLKSGIEAWVYCQ